MAEKLKAETIMADPVRSFRLWIGLLLPPITWAAQLQTVYLTSERGCMVMDFTWNHIVSIAAAAIAAVAFLVAFSEWKAAGRGTGDEAADPATRRRFMAILGMLMGALFTALILATWLPTLIGVPCSK